MASIWDNQDFDDLARIFIFVICFFVIMGTIYMAVEAMFKWFPDEKWTDPTTDRHPLLNRGPKYTVVYIGCSGDNHIATVHFKRDSSDDEMAC